MNLYTVLALVATIGGILYTIHGIKPSAIATPLLPAQYGPPRNAGRMFIDHCEEMGRDGAGVIIGRAMGQVEAEEFAAKFGKAAAKINPAPTPAPALSGVPASPTAPLPNP